MEDRQKILNKIKNMIERTQHNGCSEAEALQAAMKVGDMMSRYDVSMSEVQFANEEFNTYEIKLRSKRRNYMSYMLMSIGRFTDCKSWSGWYRSGDLYTRYRKYCFFGTKKDIMIAEYIYNVIENAIESEFNKYKKSEEYLNSRHDGRTKKANFISGITMRLANRLDDMKLDMWRENEKVYKQRADDFLNESAVGSVQEVYESTLIVYDKFEIVEKKFKDKLKLKLKTTYSSRSVKDKSSYDSGVSAGDNVNIRKAVGKSGSNNQKLIS